MTILPFFGTSAPAVLQGRAVYVIGAQKSPLKNITWFALQLIIHPYNQPRDQSLHMMYAQQAEVSISFQSERF
jgi:hypothetical protein